MGPRVKCARCGRRGARGFRVDLSRPAGHRIICTAVAACDGRAQKHAEACGIDTRPIPARDVARAAEYVRERGWV